MAMTRSQTSASGSRRDDKDQKESWKHLLKSRNLEELTNMSKTSLKKENKRQKLMSGKPMMRKKIWIFSSRILCRIMYWIYARNENARRNQQENGD